MINPPLEGAHGDAAAYALGALDAAARARFEAHLRQCLECQHEVDAFRAVTDHLALAVRQIDPPARLGFQVAARVRALSQNDARGRAVVPAIPAISIPPGPAARSAMRRRPWWQLGERVSTAVAAASLLVALTGGGYAFASHQEMTQTAQAAAQLADSLQIIYQPGMVWRTLNGTEQSPQAKARLCINPEGREAVVMTYDMPRLPKDQAYQLWLNSEEERRTSGGVFQVDDRGRGYLVVRIDGTFGQFKTAGVTREPRKGSAWPTGPRMLAGQL
jgi:anti-sigma-K factor RskA